MKDTIKAPERIYLQVCGDCTINNRETCEQCQLDNPIDPESVTWCKDRIFPNDVEYVRADVLARVYQLLKDQKEFFRT